LAELASRDVVPLTIVPECFVGVTSFDFMFPISDAPLGVVRSWTRLEDATRALMSRTTCRAGNRVEDQAGPRAAHGVAKPASPADDPVSGIAVPIGTPPAP